MQTKPRKIEGIIYITKYRAKYRADDEIPLPNDKIDSEHESLCFHTKDKQRGTNSEDS